MKGPKIDILFWIIESHDVLSEEPDSGLNARLCMKSGKREIQSFGSTAFSSLYSPKISE